MENKLKFRVKYKADVKFSVDREYYIEFIKATHDSDCAVHNMPAEPNGQCNCGADTDTANEIPKKPTNLIERSKDIRNRPAIYSLAEIFAELKNGRPVADQNFLDDCIVLLGEG